MPRWRLLILTRDYPPARGGGVRRVQALSERLVGHGFDVTVAASSGEPDIVVPPVAHHVKRTFARLRAGRVYRQAARWFLFPDEHVLDLPGEWLRIRERPDAILATAPPHSVLVSASQLARRFGCPWIADLRDPWSSLPSLVAPTVLHRMGHEALEARVLSTAAGITAATKEMADDLTARSGPAVPVHTFFNGYDPSRFEQRVTPPEGEPIVVGYYGSFYGPIDPEPLVLAAARAAQSTDVVLEHAGADLDGQLARSAREHGVTVQSAGMLSPAAAAERMQRAHVLALVLPDDARYAYCRTQKLPEYLAAGRPILGLVPPGDAERLIEAHAAGRAITSFDIDEAARAIVELAAWPTRAERPVELSWDAQVAATAEFIERVLSGRP